MNFLEELRWRGMLQDYTPEVEDYLKEGNAVGYIGFDPTADSLHVGSLAPLMMLLFFKKMGHHPIALIGGVTALIGDPSGKKEERQLLSEEQVEQNIQKISVQISNLLGDVEIVNNHDWLQKFNPITFLRDVGKFITVNYMLSKGYVKERLESELSFTEFNYMLLQAYDFYWLYENKHCKLQMGGSDQWGNITAGAELIRKKARGKAFAITCPLITKADGSKFGKTEEGNVWLDPERTSPYKFYQFWLNVSDEDAKKYIRIFTLLNKDEVEALEKEHEEAPHLRVLQNALAKEVTTRVHSEKEYENAVKASQILFGQATKEVLAELPEKQFLDVFEGVPQHSISRNELEAGIPVPDLLAEKTTILPSKGEARRTIKGGGLSINKEKVQEQELQVDEKDLINDKYILVQKGKKNYFLIIAG